MRKRSAQPSITLIAGIEQRIVRGRMAVIYGELAVIEGEVNANTVGRIVVHYAPGQLKVEHTKSHTAIRFDDALE